jgi:hypothetical protein
MLSITNVLITAPTGPYSEERMSSSLSPNFANY